MQSLLMVVLISVGGALHRVSAVLLVLCYRDAESADGGPDLSGRSSAQCLCTASCSVLQGC